MTLPVLHDAVLHTIQLDWAARTAWIRISPIVAEGSDVEYQVIQINDLRSAVLPLFAPWGSSVFINECRVLEPGTLEVEMQSGDVLKFIAEGPIRIELL